MTASIEYRVIFLTFFDETKDGWYIQQLIMANNSIMSETIIAKLTVSTTELLNLREIIKSNEFKLTWKD